MTVEERECHKVESRRAKYSERKGRKGAGNEAELKLLIGCAYSQLRRNKRTATRRRSLPSLFQLLLSRKKRLIRFNKDHNGREAT